MDTWVPLIQVHPAGILRSFSSKTEDICSVMLENQSVIIASGPSSWKNQFLVRVPVPLLLDPGFDLLLKTSNIVICPDVLWK